MDWLHGEQLLDRAPLVDPAVPIYGYVYDVKTGRLNEVAAATQAGRSLR